MAIMGVLLSGNMYVPVSGSQPKERRKLIHEKTGVRYVITNNEWKKVIEWPNETKLFLVEEMKKSEKVELPVVSPSDSAYIIMTSGSTGVPKGVEIAHASAWNTIQDINKKYQVSEQDIGLAVSAIDFDLSLYDIFGILGVGGTLVLLPEKERRNAEYWLNQIKRYHVTIWNSVPVLLDMLCICAETQKEKLPLRVVMLSGDWIGMDLPERVATLTDSCKFVAMGGATEASIWSVVFTSGLGVEQWNEGKWLGKLHYNISQTPQVWLDHQVVEMDGSLCLFWDSIDELFYPGMLDEMFRTYTGLLRGIAKKPMLVKERVNSLVSAEISETRHYANETMKTFDEKTLDEMFWEMAKKWPDREALVTENRRMTYREVREEALYISEQLRNEGVKKGEIVGVLMEKGWEQIVAVYGILFAGAAYLPLDIHNPQERLEKILNDSNTRVVLVKNRTINTRNGWLEKKKYISVSGEKCSYIVKKEKNKPENLAYVIYTSGSTGKPKGVMITHHSAANTIVDIISRREIGGKGALGDILLSSINEYGKSGYFIKNFKIEKEEKSIDSKYKIENMPEEVYIQRFLSDEIQKLAERFKLKNISEYKVFPDKITQNYILEGCARCIKEKGDDVRIYNTIFSDILEKIQIQNKSKMNWFALNIEALGRNHRKQLFLRAKDSSCITARMLVYTLKQLLNTNLPPGLYWPYEFVEGESLIAELKKDDLQISEFEEYYI